MSLWKTVSTVWNQNWACALRQSYRLRGELDGIPNLRSFHHLFKGTARFRLFSRGIWSQEKLELYGWISLNAWNLTCKTANLHLYSGFCGDIRRWLWFAFLLFLAWGIDAVVYLLTVCNIFWSKYGHSLKGKFWFRYYYILNSIYHVPRLYRYCPFAFYGIAAFVCCCCGVFLC